MNFPFSDGGDPRSTFYGVYIVQFIGFARVSRHFGDFNTRNKGLTTKLLKTSLLRNFSVAISVSPYVCFILVLILISMFLR